MQLIYLDDFLYLQEVIKGEVITPTDVTTITGVKND